jgi:uncharacterized cupredoxin-like copper-binding protein
MHPKGRRLLAVAGIALMFLPALAACGGSGTINAEVKSYEIDMAKSSASAGQVSFHVTNTTTDNETHEFVIVQTDLDSADLPLDADGNVDESQIQVVDEVEDLEPGDSGDLTVNLPAGHYVIMCNVEGHYKQGMHTNFNVQ